MKFEEKEQIYFSKTFQRLKLSSFLSQDQNIDRLQVRFVLLFLFSLNFYCYSFFLQQQWVGELEWGRSCFKIENTFQEKRQFFTFVKYSNLRLTRFCTHSKKMFLLNSNSEERCLPRPWCGWKCSEVKKNPSLRNKSCTAFQTEAQWTFGFIGPESLRFTKTDLDSVSLWCSFKDSLKIVTWSVRSRDIRGYLEGKTLYSVQILLISTELLFSLLASSQGASLLPALR